MRNSVCERSPCFHCLHAFVFRQNNIDQSIFPKVDHPWNWLLSANMSAQEIKKINIADLTPQQLIQVCKNLDSVSLFILLFCFVKSNPTLF